MGLQENTGLSAHSHTHAHQHTQATEEWDSGGAGGTWIKCNGLISSTSLIEIPHSLIFLKADFLIYFEVRQVGLRKVIFPLRCLPRHMPNYLKSPFSNRRRLPGVSEDGEKS